MNNNEILEGIKKAFKLSIDKLDNHYMFYLDEMVTPKLITLFYWILLFAFITKGLGDIFLEGDFWRGLVWVIGGSLASRVACEMVVILFRINENLNEINEKLVEADFAITNVSHSRAIIQIEGENTKEILKKGCPFNFNELKKDTCLNSTYNGMSVTIDMLDDNPDKVRIFTLRSFGESFYHSITDACLEFGYKGV